MTDNERIRPFTSTGNLSKQGKCASKMKLQKRPFGFHLMWGPVLLPGASGGLFVVLADVHNLPLGALSDQVSAHARNIFKTVAWRRRNG